MGVLVFRLGSMACESDGPVDAEVSQRLNHTSEGTWVNKKKNKKQKRAKTKKRGIQGVFISNERYRKHGIALVLTCSSFSFPLLYSLSHSNSKFYLLSSITSVLKYSWNLVYSYVMYSH